MNPILLDFPSQFETERLLLRLPLPGDGPKVHKAITESLNELKLWMPFAQTLQTEEEIEINIREAHLRFIKREDLRLQIFIKETGEFIGGTGLHRINWDVRKFEIGYWLHSNYWKNGYITEAVKGLIHFARTELEANRIEIRCDSNNTRSRTIPERLGFTLDGILMKDSLSVDQKEVRNTCIYSLVY
jgi:ribosomal-protein-serine acetyltransferase